MLIGLDLDNTLASYDAVFADTAVRHGVVPLDWRGSKQQLRELLRSHPAGDYEWQRLQGQVYGKQMHRARLFPEVGRFLLRLKQRGIRVVIVSHKTEFGHHDPERIPLRQEAIAWMESQGFFTASGFSLSRPDVFFASTREEKVQIIARLNCHAFIDDLWEVFAAADFPAHTQRILFGQPVPSSISVDFGSSSWREISHYLLGDETEVDIRGWLEHVWQRPPVDVGRMSGRGNSRIFRATDGRRAYALKLYPDPAFDVRDRLGTEAAACRFLEQEGVPSVSRLAHAEQSLNLALFDWIEGDAIRGIADTDLQQALNFVSRLQQLTQVAGAESLPQAAEACLSVEQLVRQITARERRLSQVAAGFPQLSEFLAEDFGPLFAQVRQWLKDQEPQRNLDRLLPRSLQTLSPSDFGFHNALRRSDGSLCWLDFEYFGWDDPVKLVADFLWHPAMQLTAAQQQFWVCSAVRMFQRDPDFQGRLRYCWPLYGLRWCLILLNEFLHDEWRKRSAADAGIQGRKPEKLDEQLRKAQQVLATLERYHFECPISP